MDGTITAFPALVIPQRMKPRAHPALLREGQEGGTLPVSRDDPPSSPSPSFSSVFHSSCFLHKAGVSRDSSQMFSAAHHIAFLMKYSWSLSASCHESLLQLPAMETQRRQHSCKAPGPLLPARHLHLPLPPPTSGAGAGALSPLALQVRQHQGHIQSHGWGHRCPHAAVAHPEEGPSVAGRRGQVGTDPGVGHGGVSPIPCPPGSPCSRCSPLPPAPSQPAALAMLCTIIQLGCLCKQSGFMFW